MADRSVNRLAKLIEPVVMGSVSPVVTSKPDPGAWGRVNPSMFYKNLLRLPGRDTATKLLKCSENQLFYVRHNK